ncbi:MAG: PQQ-binding-like beta-propeller repeat protein [Pirellula sp.]
MTIWIILLAAIAGDVWPGFLGAGATKPTESNVALHWSPKQGVLWQTPIDGHGQSSPVIWNDIVFVSSVDGPLKEQCIVLAYSLADGKLLWKHTIKSSDPVENSLYVSRAAPTPVVDANRVVVFFESGDIVALDHSGKEQWQRSISRDYGKFQNKFGLSGSLAQTDESVIVLVDDEGPSYLIAIDKASGSTRWKQERTARRSWSSPSLIQIDSTSHVVVSSNGSVDGYDPKTGASVWTFTDVGGNTGASPIDIGQGRFFVAASAGREGENSEMAKRSNMLMQVRREGTQWSATPLWRTEEASPSWASPIAHNGSAYWINNVGVVYCLDLESGKLHYKQRTKQSCWATPVGVGDRVYFFGKSGMTTVLAAGNEFKVLAENELWDPDSIKPPANAGSNEPTEERRRAAAMFSGPTVYGVAVANGKIIVRIGDRLFCVGSSS